MTTSDPKPNPNRLVLSAPEREALAALWATERTMAGISARMGYSQEPLRRAAREMGLPDRVNPNTPRTITDQQRELLRLLWTHEVDIPEIAKRMGCSVKVVYRFAREMNLPKRVSGQKPGKGHWTEAEVAVLRNHFGTAPVRTWMHLLPGRTRETIWNRAKLLGLRSAVNRANPARPRPIPIATAAPVSPLP